MHMDNVGDNNGCVQNDALADNDVMVCIQDSEVVPVIMIEIRNKCTLYKCQVNFNILCHLHSNYKGLRHKECLV